MTVSYLGTHEFTTDDVLAAAKEAETSRKGKNAATKEPDIFRGTSPTCRRRSPAQTVDNQQCRCIKGRSRYLLRNIDEVTDLGG